MTQHSKVWNLSETGPDAQKTSILHVTPSYVPAYIYGGPTKSISALCEGLTECAADVTVLTTTANGQEELDVKTGTLYMIRDVKVYYFARWTGDHTHLSPGLLKEVWRQCKRHDVVHIHSWWNAVSVLAGIICWTKGVVPVISPRGMLSSYAFKHNKRIIKKWLHNTVGRKILRRAIIHASSTKECNEIVRVVGKIHSFTLPNLLDLPQPHISHIDGTLRLVYLGRIDPKKNLELLFDILRDKDAPPFKLRIIGSGGEDYVARLKSLSTSIKDHVSWEGWLDGPARFDVLANSSLLVLLSKSENFGNVVIEALSQGTAVWISKEVGAKDFVENFQLGWISALDQQECKMVLKHIYENRHVLDSIRQRAPGVVQREFGRKQLATKYIKNYMDAFQHLRQGNG